MGRDLDEKVQGENVLTTDIDRARLGDFVVITAYGEPTNPHTGSTVYQYYGLTIPRQGALAVSEEGRIIWFSIEELRRTIHILLDPRAYSNRLQDMPPLVKSFINFAVEQRKYRKKK